MSPELENNPPNQNNASDPQAALPPPASPGGVIKPTDNQNPNSPQPAEPAPANPQPQTIQPSIPPQAPSPTSPAPTQDPQPSLSPSQPNTTGPNPPVNNRPIFPSDPNTPVPSSRKFSFLNKKLLLIATPLLLVFLTVGYVFGYYIPNKPENVYKTGLDRSGDALQMILDKATERGTYDKFKKTEIAATIDVSAGGQNIKGDFKAKFDGSKLDSDLNANFPLNDSQRADLGLSVLSQAVEGSEFPDTYLKVKGIKALGADLFMPGIGKYDDKWLSISSDYLQSIADQYGLEAPKHDNTDKYPTFDEISSLARDLYGDTHEYVFTSDPEKAVIENRQYLGKEDVDGVDTFHYEVALNKENYKKYCEAVSNTLLSNPVYKKFTGLNDEQIEAEKQKISENCQKDSDAIKAEDTFEMWVDSKYKLIKKIRIYSNNNKTEYFEVGQNYDGGTKISLFFDFHSDSGPFDSKATFTTDLNIGESSGELTFNGGKDSNKYDGKITLSAKPLSGDFQITEPKDAIKIQKLLKEFGIDPKDLATLYGGSLAGDTSSGINTKARDATIKSDVNSIYTHLEVYFADNAFYPTKSQFADLSWRAANMPGLTDDAFSSVAYNPSDCNFDECQKYTLSGKLSDGSTYEKTALNTLNN